jgi:type I restriction enzyme R subunit
MCCPRQFINMVIEQLTDQGTMPPELLYSPPFTDIAPTGPEAVFGVDAANALFKRIEMFNSSAVA